MRGPRAIVGALSLLVGILFLVVHLQLHPIPRSAWDLQADPPTGSEVLLTTDNAIVLDTREDGVHIVAIDQGGDNAILVAPPFAPRAPYTRQLYVFDAAWPDEPLYEERSYPREDGTSANVTLLANVVWEADRAQVAPAPWLAGAGVALLALSLVALAPAYAWAGAAAALGFAAGHVSARTPYLVPQLLVWGFGWLCLIAAFWIVAIALLRPRWRPHLATAAALAAFGAAVWAERALLAGYRPFTGIL